MMGGGAGACGVEEEKWNRSVSTLLFWLTGQPVQINGGDNNITPPTLRQGLASCLTRGDGLYHPQFAQSSP
ncbi:hypothetical protein E2C01_095476 [Portunus trituberculatus]|uniref:Uncharacterized protein n=1 Tax=Portunus trituberculatus TaxID=210409 RepID=A0A5B7K3X8_PORTR|nr:hypothetical protein [Portunus trituberculatus]